MLASQARPATGEPSAPPRVAVIIPLHRDTPGFRECLAGCLALDYPSFEVIVVCDAEVAVPTGVKLVRTGAGRDTGPGEKRDLGIHAADVDYFAFIDDDAIPRSDWLAHGVRAFDD